MHSSYDFNYLRTLSVKYILRLIKKAMEEQEKKKAWDMWIVKYQHMDEKTFIPFTKFFKFQTQDISQRSADEILAEAEAIRNKLRKKEGE